jgi:hypothetical protein
MRILEYILSVLMILDSQNSLLEMNKFCYPDIMKGQLFVIVYYWGQNMKLILCIYKTFKIIYIR